MVAFSNHEFNAVRLSEILPGPIRLRAVGPYFGREGGFSEISPPNSTVTTPQDNTRYHVTGSPMLSFSVITLSLSLSGRRQIESDHTCLKGT